MSKKCEVASEKSFEETGKGYLNGTIKKKRHMQIENINRENNSSRRTNFWIFNTTGVD